MKAALHILFFIVFCQLVISFTDAKNSKFISDGTDFVIGIESCQCLLRSKRSTEDKAPCGPVCRYGAPIVNNLNFNEYNKSFYEEIEIIFSNEIDEKRDAYAISKEIEKDGNSQKLTFEEILSVYTYSLPDPIAMYIEFNKQTREMGSDHEDFRYPGMYYFLHRAVNKLAIQATITVYRGVTYAVQALVGDMFYFNCFTSTSTNPSVADNFADEGNVGTLFEIDTDIGAMIAEYSSIEDEKEVLLPPCAHFKVISINKDGKFPRFKLKSIDSTCSTPKANKPCGTFEFL